MDHKVALLSSQVHCDYIKDILKDTELPFTLEYVPYHRVTELVEMFPVIKDRYDAFCTTGAFTREALLRQHPGLGKPIGAIKESVAEFYRLLLKLLYEDRSCDFTRIYFDHSLWMPDESTPLTAYDYLYGTAEFDEDGRRRMLEQMSLDRLLQAEPVIVENARSLQREGKLSLVVCRHSSVYDALKEEHIPCVFAYPSANNIKESLGRLAEEMELLRMEDNRPAVICLSCGELTAVGPEDITQESLALQKCLLDFDQENIAGMLIKRSAVGFELFTTQHTVRRLTDKFTRCLLSKYIFGRLGREANIGYGTGSDIMTARTNALKALELSEKNGRSYMVSANGTEAVLLPQNGETEQKRQDEHLETAAQRTGLSVTTLQRILSAMDLLGSREVTTQELAGALQVTVANANRFINQLQAAGCAAVVGEKKALVRGRPTRIYRIDI